MGTQRKKAEHVTFNGHFERRTNSTKRLHTQEPRRAARITRLLFELPILWFRRRQLEPKSTKNHSKMDRNEIKIYEKLILGRFRRPRPFRGCVLTRSGRFWDAQMPPQDQSWDAPGEPRAAGSCPKVSLGRPGKAPRPSGEPSERLWYAERRRTRSWNDFPSFFRRRAETPMYEQCN